MCHQLEGYHRMYNPGLTGFLYYWTPRNCAVQNPVNSGSHIQRYHSSTYYVTYFDVGYWDGAVSIIDFYVLKFLIC